MSSENEFKVSEDLVKLTRDLIAKNNWEPISDVKYFPGTEAGDGYASKHVAIEITTKDETIKLFSKYALQFKENVPEDWQIGKFYANETYFYDVVYPAYRIFLKEKNVKDGFRNAPKCYGTSKENVIVLENIKTKGFALFDRKKIMDEGHITLVLKTFAKFHATSFAFKDQSKEEYNKLVDGWNGDVFHELPKDSPMLKMWFNMIQEGLDKFDQEKDKHIIERCDVNVLTDSIFDVMKHTNEYSILTQGDCWCNNIMFLYENDNKEEPTDVMLVDWQILRPASPVFDLSYFYFTIATEESLNKLDHYLEVYYGELCRHLKELGSDPEVVYPKPVFEKEWQQHCKYGFAMAFILLKFMLVNKDDVPKFEELDVEEITKSETLPFFTKFDKDDEYVGRLRTIAGCMIDRNYI